ncbi:MAG: PHP domain-containing protein [Lachnospiraceae bacterium]|nr:PHP domain-containing protein [Lachnospiraceae bacterium]
MNENEYKYRTELHMHTSPASGCSEIPPQEAVETYSRLGYNSVVITNHFYKGMRFCEDREKCIETYLQDYDLAVETGKKLGVHVIFGCEIRFTENNNDYLLFGIDRNFLETAWESFDLGIEAFSRRYRKDGVMIIQAHPNRDYMVKVDPQCLDGIEAFNLHPHHNSRVGLTASYAKSHGLLITAGTDYHHPGHEGLTALRTKEEMKDQADLVRVLRSRDYLLELGGYVLIP